MEEPKTAETLKTANGREQPPAAAAAQSASNKRKFSGGDVDLQSSSYFKIRALVRQLRPHLIQVLQTPDFRNCKAAHDLRKQMKLLMDGYKQVTADDGHQDCTLSAQLQAKRYLEQPAEPFPSLALQAELNDTRIRESYIMGGSAVGWNFITWSGSGPVYCGVTKQSFQNIRKTVRNQRSHI